MECCLKDGNEGSEQAWLTMPDASLVIGQNVEIASPILTDNYTDIEEIYMICNMR